MALCEVRTKVRDAASFVSMIVLWWKRDKREFCKVTPQPLYFLLCFFCVLCSFLSPLASLDRRLLRVLVVLLLEYRGKSKQFAYTLWRSRLCGPTTATPSAPPGRDSVSTWPMMACRKGIIITRMTVT